MDDKERLRLALMANERDRTVVSICVHRLKKTVNSYRWLKDGRGSYAYDDEKYREEFGRAIEEIETQLAELLKIATDLRDCPTDQMDIKEAIKDLPK